VFLGILIGIPVVLLFLVVGLLLWVYYQRPDLSGRATPEYLAGDSAEIFLKFILREMPAGAAGLMIAGVLAAGPAGINASLNSMASTFVGDVYRPARPGRDDGHYVRVGRAAVVAWGVVLGGFAMLCIAWRSSSGMDIITFALAVMSFAYAGLLGVFLTALFTRRGSTASAIAALVAGFVTVLAMQKWLWVQWAPFFTWTVYTPGGSAEHSLANLNLSWTWHLVIGTAVATAVCMLGRRRTLSATGSGTTGA
jgi:Na+/proline symporter